MTFETWILFIMDKGYINIKHEYLFDATFIYEKVIICQPNKTIIYENLI